MSQDEMLVEHKKTWHGFVKLIVISTAVVVIPLALMGIFLV
jgi:hypothetical protein